MISNIRTDKFARGSRVNFDILCDVCGDDSCIWGENGKTFCWKHKGKSLFIENKETKEVKPKTYEDGITVGERNIIEKIKTMESGTETLKEARLFSQALSKFLNKLKKNS